MYRKLFILFLVMYFAPLFIGAKSIGPDVSVYRNEELKWEDGAYGYHVMFKTLLKNLVADSDSGNPQADTCVDEATGSTYKLTGCNVPADASVERAFLVWSGAVPIAEKNDPTDNEVTLSFVSDDGTITETQAVKGKKAYKVSEAQGFEFDAFRDTDDTDLSYFTYRVDVTDFFKSIQEKGRDQGIEDDGYSLYGNYTVKDLKCASDSAYVSKTVMVSGWSIIMIYTSKDISPKKIYLYDGFKSYWYEQSEINVTGFEFPTDPEIRITLNTHEGDPNLASVYDDDDNLAPPEGLQVQGDNVGWLLLSNECNPSASVSDGYTTLYYTEVYNSISSTYCWADVSPTCVGGTPPVWDYENIEYGMDADTFVLDTSLNDSYAAHFNKGGTHMALRIGANKDQIITNYMVVSVDTKAPTFDIPGQPEKIACTPTNTAIDPNDPNSSWCGNGLEHVFTIRVQNWGDDITPAIIVKDTIPANMEYVSGSTQYATEFTTEGDKKIATKWISVPDNGGFPLESGVKVADSMNFCPAGSDYLSCPYLIMVRFRAKVLSTTAKNVTIENVADINTTGFPTYKTNLGISIKLKNADTGCVSTQDEVNLDYCGGNGAPVCETDAECVESKGQNYVCDPTEKTCIIDPSKVECKDSSITVALGKNSSANDDVIFIAPQSDLVLGQIAVTAASGNDCYFNLAKLKMKMEVEDSNILITNIRLINDENGDGRVTSGEAQLGSAEINNTYIDFAPSGTTGWMWANKINNLIVVADAAYLEGEKISKSAWFTPSIEEKSITFTDSGTTTLSGLPITFNKFQFVPDNAFVVTKGYNDPAVPEKSKMNGTHDIMQLRVISTGSSDSMTSMKIKIPKAAMASFGTAISSLALYEDTNNDGTGDVKIAEAATTDGLQSHTFKLDIPIEADVEKFFTIRANLNLSDGEYFQFEILSVSTANDQSVLGTPVNSKEYSYTCDPLYEECGSDSDSCSCTITAAENEGYAGIIMILCAALFSLLFFTRKESKNR